MHQVTSVLLRSPGVVIPPLEVVECFVRILERRLAGIVERLACVLALQEREQRVGPLGGDRRVARRAAVSARDVGLGAVAPTSPASASASSAAFPASVVARFMNAPTRTGVPSGPAGTVG